MPNSEQTSGSSGMRSLWLRCLSFLLVLVPCWVCLEWGMGRTQNAQSIKRDLIHAHAREVDTLILGSSETYYGISPHQLSGTAFNLANPAQSLYFDYQLTERLLPELPRLRRVIILANYMSLYLELYDHPESFRQYQYYQEWGIPLQRTADYFDLRSLSRVAVYGPQAALKALVKGFHVNLAPRVDDRGWYRVPDEDRWGLGVEQAQGRLDVHHGFMHEEYVPKNIAMLERLLVLLRAHDVEAVMVTTPVWATYQTRLRQRWWQRSKGTYETLARKHGARYLNFQNEPRLTAADFEDADHLNADGAARFAKLLDTSLGSAVQAKRVIAGDRESGQGG